MNTIVVLVVTLFTYTSDGGVGSKVRHEFVQDSMTECRSVAKITMDDYYAHSSKTTGIMTMCRRQRLEVSSDER